MENLSGKQDVTWPAIFLHVMRKYRAGVGIAVISSVLVLLFVSYSGRDIDIFGIKIVTPRPRSISSELPIGAVVSFATACPSERGWEDYQPGRGRFIVGANPRGDGLTMQRWRLSLPNGQTSDYRIDDYELGQRGGVQGLALFGAVPQAIVRDENGAATRLRPEISMKFGRPFTGMSSDATSNLPRSESANQEFNVVIPPDPKNRNFKTVPPFVALNLCIKRRERVLADD